MYVYIHWLLLGEEEVIYWKRLNESREETRTKNQKGNKHKRGTDKVSEENSNLTKSSSNPSSAVCNSTSNCFPCCDYPHYFVVMGE